MATRYTRNQTKAFAAMRVRAVARLRQVRDLSDHGASIEQVASVLGVTKGSVRKMLIRAVGTSAWPIQEGGAL